MSETRYTLECQCGNTIPSDRPMRWCLECGRQVFLDAKTERRHKLNQYYTQAMIVMVVLFLGYIVYVTLFPEGM